jgi:leader peptidase (prepilin peptidase)/N-methyltransferase
MEFIIITVLGLIVGSFLSMLIPRLHFEEKGIFLGRSHCAKCKKTLAARDLIPLFSFLLNGGKCRFCKKKISFFYPALELTTALTFLGLYFYNPELEILIPNLINFTILLFIFFYDLRFKEIHDGVMIPGIILAFLLAIIGGNLASASLGALIGFAFSASILISKGKWIGLGDLIIGFSWTHFGWEKCCSRFIYFGFNSRNRHDRKQKPI